MAGDRHRKSAPRQAPGAPFTALDRHLSNTLAGLARDAADDVALAAALVSRAVGQKKCMEMLMTAKLYSAEESDEMDLVNMVFEDEQLHEKTMELAKDICKSSKYAIYMAKQNFYAQVEMTEAGEDEREERRGEGAMARRQPPPLGDHRPRRGPLRRGVETPKPVVLRQGGRAPSAQNPSIV